ncbi:MAG: class I SAM-dependent DNA methyltransferase [Candidatus Izemoplasmataceae bacterium]
MSYNLLAKYYDAIIDDALYAFYLDVVEQYCPNCKILELGCGTAYISRELAKKGYNITAVDQSEAMLEFASLYAAVEGVNITFYQHDMHEPLPLMFDLILMPIDVINHATSLDAMKKIFHHVYEALNPKGTFIFDVLDCDYIAKLIGHEETINVDQDTIKWRVDEGNKPCSLLHTVETSDSKDSHQIRSYPFDVIEKAFNLFSVHDKIVLEDRIIYVLKK